VDCLVYCGASFHIATDGNNVIYLFFTPALSLLERLRAGVPVSGSSCFSLLKDQGALATGPHGELLPKLVAGGEQAVPLTSIICSFSRHLIKSPIYNTAFRSSSKCKVAKGLCVTPQRSDGV